MKISETTFNIQHSTLNIEPSGDGPAPVIECWALNVECSMFPETFQP